MVASAKGFVRTVALFALVGAAAACATRRVEHQPGAKAMPEQTIEAVLEQHTGSLMSLPGVVGTAIGECEGKPCIEVFVIRRTRELTAKIPLALQGFSVAIEETGEIRALESR